MLLTENEYISSNWREKRLDLGDSEDTVANLETYYVVREGVESRITPERLKLLGERGELVAAEEIRLFFVHDIFNMMTSQVGDRS